MDEINQLVDTPTRSTVHSIFSNDKKLVHNCDEVKPKNSEFVGMGVGRCVYEKNDKIIKIAHGASGIRQNESAKIVKNKVSDSNMDSFAEPLDVNEDNTIMVQEKVTPWGKFRTTDEWIDERIEAQDKIEYKNAKTWMEDGVYCRDFEGPSNWGIKNQDIVLTDLGMCTDEDLRETIRSKQVRILDEHNQN